MKLSAFQTHTRRLCTTLTLATITLALLTLLACVPQKEPNPCVGGLCQSATPNGSAKGWQLHAPSFSAGGGEMRDREGTWKLHSITSPTDIVVESKHSSGTWSIETGRSIRR